MSKQLSRKLAARQRHDALATITDLIANSSATLSVPESQTLARWTERYRNLRRQGVKFTNPLVTALPKEVMDVAAEELGILDRGVYVFESEEEMNVLMDHALHYAPPGKATFVASYFQSNPPAPGSDAEVLARGVLGARFVLAFVVERFPGFGLEVRDFLTGEPFLVADIHFSQSKCLGLTLAGRLHPLDDFWMFSGAMVPVIQGDALARIAQYFQRVLGGWRPLIGLAPDRQRLAESFILRTSLEYEPFARMRTENL